MSYIVAPRLIFNENEPTLPCYCSFHMNLICMIHTYEICIHISFAHSNLPRLLKKSTQTHLENGGYMK